MTVCPFCGADQTHPVEFVAPNLPQPPTIQSTLHDWGIELVVLVVVVGLIIGIFWQDFRVQSISPDLQAANVAARSLRDLREVLSSYALYMKDVYPMNLDSLGDRTTLPIQSARSAGYELQYLPKQFSRDGAPRGFAILARSEKTDYLNLYIDESGVVRATQEDRAATVRDPPF